MQEVATTREERRAQLEEMAAMRDGTHALNAILVNAPVRFEKLPLLTLMIEAILDHEYPQLI